MNERERAALAKQRDLANVIERELDGLVARELVDAITLIAWDQGWRPVRKSLMSGE